MGLKYVTQGAKGSAKVMRSKTREAPRPITFKQFHRENAAARKASEKK